MFTSNLFRYVADHWSGRQSLAWSFWINLVLLRLLVFFGQSLLRPAEGHDYSDRQPLILAVAIFIHAGLFVWQIVGVLRAGEAHVRTRGSIANVWGAYAGILIAFWLTASFAFEIWQTTLPIPAEENFAERMELEHASKYEIKVSSDENSISIDGTIALGITRNFALWLDQNPTIRTVILTSDGGNIFEARGLSKLIRSNKLDTFVKRRCSSACTTAFIGGRHRSIRHGGQLGFHKYRVDADYTVLAANPEAEQERDRALFAKQGVESAFLEKIFSLPADQMWFPSMQELVDGGVVTEIKSRP